MTSIFGSSIIPFVNKYGAFPPKIAYVTNNIFCSLADAAPNKYLNIIDSPSIINGAVFTFDNATVTNPIPVTNSASHIKFIMITYVTDNDVAYLAMSSDGRVYTRGYYNGSFTNWIVMPGTDLQNVNIDMNSKSIISILDPVNDQDAVTKYYSDWKTGNCWGIAGNTLVNYLSSLGTKNDYDFSIIRNLVIQMTFYSTSIKAFNNFFVLNPNADVKHGCINLDNAFNFYSYLGDVNNYIKQGNSAMTIKSNDTLAINSTGITIDNAVNLSSKNISSLADPTSAQDAASKNYVDTAKPYYLKVSMTSNNTLNWIRAITITGTEGSCIELNVQLKKYFRCWCFNGYYIY